APSARKRVRRQAHRLSAPPARKRKGRGAVRLTRPSHGYRRASPAICNGLLSRSFLDRSVGRSRVGRRSVGGVGGVGRLGRDVGGLFHRGFLDDGGVLGDRLFGGGVAAAGRQSEQGGGREGSQSNLLHNSSPRMGLVPRETRSGASAASNNGKNVALQATPQREGVIPRCG